MKLARSGDLRGLPGVGGAARSPAWREPGAVVRSWTRQGWPSGKAWRWPATAGRAAAAPAKSPTGAGPTGAGPAGEEPARARTPGVVDEGRCAGPPALDRAAAGWRPDRGGIAPTDDAPVPKGRRATAGKPSCSRRGTPMRRTMAASLAAVPMTTNARRARSPTSKDCSISLNYSPGPPSRLAGAT